MKKIWISTILAAFCFTANTAMAQNDAKAKTVLDGVTKKVNGLKSMKANFTLHLAGGNGKVNETKKGSFTMKGQKYHVLLAGQEIICDGKTVWTYTKDANEVQVSNYNPNEQTISPSKLFTNFYDKEYKYSYVGEKKVNGKNTDVVDLTPTSAKKQFTKVELMIDKSTSMIAGGSIWQKNGNQYKYEVSNFSPNPNVPESDFTFNAAAHKGVEVVDLR